MPDPRSRKNLKRKDIQKGDRLIPPEKESQPDTLCYISFSFRFLQNGYHINDWEERDRLALLVSCLRNILT